MQVNQIFQKLKKKINERKPSINKINKNIINNESIEFKKIYILSPRMNITNKEYYIIKTLKKEFNNTTQEKINNIPILNNNKKNEDKFLKKEKEKIKVKLNSIKTPKVNNINSEKNSNHKLKDAHSKIKSNKTIIFNYSFLDKKNNKNNSNIFNSIKKSFEFFKKINNFQKNKNLSENNYFKRQFVKSEKSFKNSINLNNIKKDKEKNYLFKNLKLSRFKLRQGISRIGFNKNNNIELNYINDNNSSVNTKIYGNNSCLTKNNYNKISASLNSSTKTITENPKLKLNINNNRNNNVQDNSLFSSKYKYIQNTYQKKLVKNYFRKKDNYLNNKKYKLVKIHKFENSKKFNKNNIFDNQNYSYNSPKNCSSSNNSSFFGFSNDKIKNQNDKLINNATKQNQLNTQIYNQNSFKILNFNKEKDETKYQTNFISDNNYSTNYSFYNNINKNSLANNKLTSATKSEHKLKNIITSIDYKNINNKFHNYEINKNIILYEFNRDGKVNYKIKEMKNSVEKIVREKSNSKVKDKTKFFDFSPKNYNEFSLYVKKNQGTVLRKNKNKMEFFNPYCNN